MDRQKDSQRDRHKRKTDTCVRIHPVQFELVSFVMFSIQFDVFGSVFFWIRLTFAECT